MNVRYRVDLSQAERGDLGALVSGGKQPVRRLKRMQILLAADYGVRDVAIAAAVQSSGSTLYRTKKRFLEMSLEKSPSLSAPKSRGPPITPPRANALALFGGPSTLRAAAERAWGGDEAGMKALLPRNLMFCATHSV